MSNIPVETAARVTDNCGDGTLMCPVCGGGYLHPGKVTEVKDGGVYIAFSCENCSMGEMSLAPTIGYLRILFRKGNTHLTWEVNPAFANLELVSEHAVLIDRYYDVVSKLNGLRARAKPKSSAEIFVEHITLEWDK